MTTSKSYVQRFGLVSIALMGACFVPQVASAQDDKPTAGSFVDNFERLDTSRWYISDGWNNGPFQNCTWSRKQVTVTDGMLQLQFLQSKTGQRNYACGEIQTTKRYGYGTSEARYRTARGSGLNSAFLTYIGPTEYDEAKQARELDLPVTCEMWERNRLVARINPRVA